MNYHNLLKKIFTSVFEKDVKFAREFKNLPPYTVSEMTEFIKTHDNKIEDAVQKIIYEYHHKNKIELLLQPMTHSFVQNYLYSV